MTADWLAEILYEALQRGAAGRIPIAAQPWGTLAEADRAVFRDALTVTLERFDDPSLLKLREGEPIFVLRAQDRVAPHTIDLWAAAAGSFDAPHPKLLAAVTRAGEMRLWQEQHPQAVKIPD